MKSKHHYYHYSKRRLRVGTVLWGRSADFNRLESHEFGTFMTTSPVPHCTMVIEVLEHGGHVYEVEPLGKVYPGLFWGECYCPEGAEIVRYVGNARGLLRNSMKKKGEIPIGSSVKFHKFVQQWKRLGR